MPLMLYRGAVRAPRVNSSVNVRADCVALTDSAVAMSLVLACVIAQHLASRLIG